MNEKSLEKIVAAIKGGQRRYYIRSSLETFALILTVFIVCLLIDRGTALRFLPLAVALILINIIKIHVQWSKLTREATELGITPEIAELAPTDLFEN